MNKLANNKILVFLLAWQNYTAYQKLSLFVNHVTLFDG